MAYEFTFMVCFQSLYSHYDELDVSQEEETRHHTICWNMVENLEQRDPPFFVGLRGCFLLYGSNSFKPNDPAMMSLLVMGARHRIDAAAIL